MTQRLNLNEEAHNLDKESIKFISGFSGVRVTRSLVLCVMFCRSLFALLSFYLFAIVLSVLLPFTDSSAGFRTNEALC